MQRITKTTLLFGIAILAGACTTSQTPKTGTEIEEEGIRPVRSSDFWGLLRVQGDEVTGADSLDDLAEKSDIVVRGNFVSFDLNRKIFTDAEEDIVNYGVARLRIKEVLRGETTARMVPVEFLLPHLDSKISDVVRSLKENLYKDELVLFLHKKRGSGERDFYRLTNQSSLWIQDQEQIRAPLGEEITAGNAVKVFADPSELEAEVLANPDRTVPTQEPEDLSTDPRKHGHDHNHDADIEVHKHISFDDEIKTFKTIAQVSEYLR